MRSVPALFSVMLQRFLNFLVETFHWDVRPLGVAFRRHIPWDLCEYISVLPLYLFRTAENKPGLSLPAVGFNAAAKVLLIMLSRWDYAEKLSWNDFAEGHLFIKISKYMVYSCYSSWTPLAQGAEGTSRKKDESGNVWKKTVWKSVLHIL